MKSSFRILIIWAIIFTTAFYISSCCTDEFKIIGPGTALVFTDDFTFDMNTDSIVGPFTIEINPELELAFLGLTQLGFTEALALSCDFNVLNRLESESLTIQLDKDIDINGTMISAGSDLTELEVINENSFIFNETISIRFSEELLQIVTFEKEAYTFTIQFKTIDELNLSHEINLKMNL